MFLSPPQTASLPCCSGQIRPLSSRLALIATGSTPFTGITELSSPNSPSTIYSESSSCGKISIQVKMPTAIGRSKCEPSLSRLAGAKLMVMRLAGKLIPIA